jgi:hypothetical protein
MANGDSVTCPWSGESSAPIPETTPAADTGFSVVPVLVVLVLVLAAAVLARW